MSETQSETQRETQRERHTERERERERTQEGNLERYFNTRDYQSKLTKLGSLKSFSP